MAHLDVKPSQADLDHYRFLLELNQTAQIGLTQNEIINLITCPLSWVPSTVSYYVNPCVDVSSGCTTGRSSRHLKPELNTHAYIQKGVRGLTARNRHNKSLEHELDQKPGETELQVGHRELRAAQENPPVKEVRNTETSNPVKNLTTAVVQSSYNDSYSYSRHTSRADFSRDQGHESPFDHHEPRVESGALNPEIKSLNQTIAVSIQSNSKAFGPGGSTERRATEVVQEPNLDHPEENKIARRNDSASVNLNTVGQQKQEKIVDSSGSEKSQPQINFTVHFKAENISGDRCPENNFSAAMLQGSIWKFAHSSDCFLSNCARKCHRIPMSPWNHAFLQCHPAVRAAIIMLLNRPLNKRGNAMYILSDSPEVHISSPEDKLDSVLRILWCTASHCGIQPYIPELDPQRTAIPNKIRAGAQYSYWSDQPRVIIHLAPPQPEDSWRCYNFPDCSNKRRPGDRACHIISFSPHEGSHLLVCDFDSKNNLFRKLNAHFDGQDVQISLLCRMPVIHVMGQRSDDALSILRRIIGGVKSESVIRKLFRDYL